MIPIILCYLRDNYLFRRIVVRWPSFDAHITVTLSSNTRQMQYMRIYAYVLINNIIKQIKDAKSYKLIIFNL